MPQAVPDPGHHPPCQWVTVTVTVPHRRERLQPENGADRSLQTPTHFFSSVHRLCISFPEVRLFFIPDLNSPATERSR